MTQCNATAYLINADGARIPDLAPIRCELEVGHDDAERQARECCGGRPEDHPATDHAFAFRWAEPTADELAEVYDPDESFDLEVDIAPAEVIEHQARVTADRRECERCRWEDGYGAREPIGHDHPEPVEPIPDANPRCLVCGREVEWVGDRWVHRGAPRGHRAEHYGRG